MNQEAFEQAKIKVLLKQHDPHGFGTLQEKTVHAVMKLYYEPDIDYHEVPIYIQEALLLKSRTGISTVCGINCKLFCRYIRSW